MSVHLPQAARIDVPAPDLANTRTRLDLMWHDGMLGIRERTRDDGSFMFHRIEDPDAAPPLKLMAREFADDPPPVAQAQVRFRCAPVGRSNVIETSAGDPPDHSSLSAANDDPFHRGVWIDVSRRDIAHLFAERSWLGRTLARGWIVELGQRGEAAAAGPHGPVVVDSPRISWLPSFDGTGRPIPLVSTIASFSQPGPAANRALIAAAFRVLDAAGIDQASWFEWGAGYGNLSAAMARRLGDDGTATEAHPLAAELLEENRKQHFGRIRTLRLAAEGSESTSVQAMIWIIDPPRPGFGRLLETLVARKARPDRVLAFHCHAAGLANDSAILAGAGAHVEAWTSVDLFPGSPHRETISLWKVT